MAISSPGLGSNLNVNQIVSQLMAIEQQPVDRLNTKEASFQAQLSSYGNIRSALSTFQGAVESLGSPTRFQTRTASSSDTTIVTGSAANSAQSGSYRIDVTSLAQAQTIAATGQATTTATIGAGGSTTLTFSFGTVSGGTLTNGVYAGATFTPDASAETGTVTIDSSNNSLAGIKDAINAADIGVRASIVGDGSANPYRLVLQSTVSGAKGSIKLSVSGDTDLQNLLAYDPAGTQNLTQTAAGQDAVATINGLSITSGTNSITNAVPGVTLSLVKAGTATLTVARDTSSVQKGVEDLVKAYNDLNTAVGNATSADVANKTKQPLNGDATARSILAQLRSELGGSIGAGFKYNTLSQVGIAFQRNGTLSFDSSKLQTALGADPDAVAALFAASGTATDSLVSVKKQTTDTQPGTYGVEVTQLATQGKLVGSAAANLVISSGVNDSLAVSLNGTTATVKLTTGTYTASTLASVLQSAINGTSSFSSLGYGVTVEQNSGIFSILSKRYGADSSVVVGGIGAAGLLGGSPTATTGVDIAGTIDDIAATGSGQVLTGQDGSATEGLQVEVTGGSTGSRGSVTVGKGFGARLSALVDTFLGSTGAIASRTEGINRSIQDIEDRKDVLSRRLADVEARYRAQFTALDKLMSNMTSTSTFLTQQLAKLNSSS